MAKTFEEGFNLKGKVAVVTGAAAGIGLAVSELFAAQGASLVMLDLSQEVHEIVKKLPGNHLAITCNIADLTQINDVVKQAEACFGTIDILINRSGPGESDSWISDISASMATKVAAL